jgi:quercetin dioxygenase-like cupin family protein
MAEQSYLDGGLTIQALGANTGAGPFRGEDARGSVAWLARGEPFAYLHAIEFAAPGVRRGFHAHPGHRERLYLFSGAVRLLAGHAGATVDLLLQPGDLVTFAPGVAHGLIAETPAFAVAFGSGTDPIADCIACPELG